jgi:hypothetical protein
LTCILTDESVNRRFPRSGRESGQRAPALANRGLAPYVGREFVLAKPQIVTANELGLAFANLFGVLGPELHVTGHYSAGARAKTAAEAKQRAKEFHAFHKSKGWGGMAYHYLIGDDGTLVCARPTLLKGAHTGGHNSNNIGIVMPGTAGDLPTPAQRKTYRWLIRNAHTMKLPKAHRTDRDLSLAELHAHKQWPGNFTSCPGGFQHMYLKGLG